MLQARREDFAAKPLILILGMNRDKDVLKFLRCFQTPPALVLATRAESPRSMDPDELAGIVENHGWQVQTVDLEDAWNVALGKATTDSIILATGSFYVIGALRRIWLQEQN